MIEHNPPKFADFDAHIDEALQEKLHRAQDQVADKQAQIGSLNEAITKAKSALEVDREKLSDAEVAAKSAYQGHGADTKKLEAATKAARTDKNTALSKVQQGQETVDDLEQGLSYAMVELGELEKARDKCRFRILRALMLATKFPQPHGEKARLLGQDPISVEDMVMAFILHMEMGPGGVNPFAGEVVSPQRFFAFIAQYFGVPSLDDFAAIRSRFDAKIWGDYEMPAKGGRGRKASNSHTPQLNWELMGTGIGSST